MIMRRGRAHEPGAVFCGAGGFVAVAPCRSPCSRPCRECRIGRGLNSGAAAGCGGTFSAVCRANRRGFS